MKKKIKIIFGNIIVLCILLVLVEVVLQLTGIGSYSSAPLNSDPVFHHVHPVDYQFLSYSHTEEFQPLNVFYDEDGLVIPPPSNNYKHDKSNKSIAFLGDSFVESNQVAYDSSFIGRLQAENRDIELLNYGVSSYSPSIHYLLVKHKVLARNPLPKKVFLMLYSNDVRDDENYLADAVYNESNDLVAINGGTPNRLIATLRRFHLPRLLRKAQVTLKFMLQEKPKQEDQAIVGDHLEENPDWNGTESADYVIKTAQLLNSKGIRFYLTVVPSKYNHFYKDYQRPDFSEKLKNWASNNNITFIDLTEPFKTWREQHEGSLFYEKDIHFNNRGHSIVANALRSFIKEDEVGASE